jgi:hypothetical protein
MATVDACKGVIDGRVPGGDAAWRQSGPVGSGPLRNEPAWRKLRLTVHVATKLNRSHLVHGEVSYLLPCLSRIEVDARLGKPQAVSMEDSTGCMHGSRGVALPASDRLLSEQAMVAGIAMATLDQSSVDWEAWSSDYALIRDAIAQTYPDICHDFNARLWTPGGFHRPLPAPERKWQTESRKAEFLVPETLNEEPRHAGAQPHGFASVHAAQRQSVQHDDLSARRPLSRHQRHADGRIDERRGHRPSRARSGYVDILRSGLAGWNEATGRWLQGGEFRSA